MTERGFFRRVLLEVQAQRRDVAVLSTPYPSRSHTHGNPNRTAVAHVGDLGLPIRRRATPFLLHQLEGRREREFHRLLLLEDRRRRERFWLFHRFALRRLRDERRRPEEQQSTRREAAADHPSAQRAAKKDRKSVV